MATDGTDKNTIIRRECFLKYTFLDPYLLFYFIQGFLRNFISSVARMIESLYSTGFKWQQMKVQSSVATQKKINY